MALKYCRLLCDRHLVHAGILYAAYSCAEFSNYKISRAQDLIWQLQLEVAESIQASYVIVITGQYSGLFRCKAHYGAGCHNSLYRYQITFTARHTAKLRPEGLESTAVGPTCLAAERDDNWRFIVPQLQKAHTLLRSPLRCSRRCAFSECRPECAIVLCESTVKCLELLSGRSCKSISCPPSKKGKLLTILWLRLQCRCCSRCSLPLVKRLQQKAVSDRLGLVNRPML